MFNVDISNTGQRPIIAIKDKNNSLLIIKLRLGTVAGGTVTGGVESSVDFNETFSFKLYRKIYHSLKNGVCEKRGPVS